MQVVNAKPVLEWIEGLSVDPDTWQQSLRDWPHPSRDSNWEEISEYLFDRGVASSAIEHLMDQIEELIRIARWYQRTGDPSEAETTACPGRRCLFLGSPGNMIKKLIPRQENCNIPAKLRKKMNQDLCDI
ncbi:MAG TPA: hypothetical protein GXX25_02230 [Desulfotomaculum sp.]|nr:hypothetical protein [Desulfotomaculum sp.]